MFKITILALNERNFFEWRIVTSQGEPLTRMEYNLMANFADFAKFNIRIR